jgi:hypothetical protein
MSRETTLSALDLCKCASDLDIRGLHVSVLAQAECKSIEPGCVLRSQLLAEGLGSLQGGLPSLQTCDSIGAPAQSAH